MKKHKMSRLVAKVVFRTALETAGDASRWYEYQPKEPEKLKSKRENLQNIQNKNRF